MFESLLAPWRAKFRLAVFPAPCFTIAAVAGSIAFAFGLAALYSWLAQGFSPIIACLIIAGAFLVIAILPILIYGAKQRAEEKRVAEAVAKARATQWISPSTLSLGLQAARIMGRNRGLAAAGVGALVIGWLISQMMPGEAQADGETAAA